MKTMKRLLKNIIKAFHADEMGYETCHKFHNIIHKNGIDAVDGEIMKLLGSLEPSRKVYEIEIFIDLYNGFDGSNPLSGADPDHVVVNGRSVYYCGNKFLSEKPVKEYLEKYNHIKSFKVGNYSLHLHVK